MFLVNKPYTRAQRMFDVILPKFGGTTYIDGRDIANFRRILPNTSVIYLESPEQLVCPFAGPGSRCRTGKTGRHCYHHR